MPAIDEFMIVLRNAGLILDGAVIRDGQWHRTSVDSDRRGQKNGSYLFIEGNGFARGVAHNFKDASRSISWKSEKTSSVYARPYDESRLRIIREQRARQDQMDIESKIRVARGLRNRLTQLRPAISHPYLTRKRVSVHGLMISGHVLIMPLRDIDGEVWSAQSIYPDGTKINLKGGRKSGCFHLIGEIRDGVPIVVAEGYATAASIHEATGWPVAVAIDSGNLVHVANALSGQYRAFRIVVCGDDDRFEKCGVAWADGQYIKGVTSSNVGRVKATEAAWSSGGVVVFPQFHPGDFNSTDFNDAALSGVDIGSQLTSFVGQADRRKRSLRMSF